MLYLARATGCVVGLPFKQLNKKYMPRKNQLKLMIMKEVTLFLACIVCIQLCLLLLSNALRQVGILPWYKSFSHYLNLGRPSLVGVKNKLKAYLALHIPNSCFVVQPHSSWLTLGYFDYFISVSKKSLKLSFKSPPKALLRFFKECVGQMLPRTESILCDVRFVLHCTCSWGAIVKRFDGRCWLRTFKIRHFDLKF